LCSRTWFLSNERSHILADGIRGGPDLVEVLALSTSGIAGRHTFNQSTPIVSRVLPAFTSTLGAILGY